MKKTTTKLSAAARREENWGYFMIAPTIIGLVVLNLWPFIQTIYTSFCEHLGFGNYKFIGIRNYSRTLRSGGPPGTPSCSVSSPCLWGCSCPCWWP